MKSKLSFFGILLALALPGISLAQQPIPSCPLEGPNVFFTRNLRSAAATNCQPRQPTDVEYAQCWTRSPDALIPAYVTECTCRASQSDLTPGRIPGIYSVAASGPCPPGVAAVLTSLVGDRQWGVDGGCDDPGDLCVKTAATAKPRTRTITTMHTHQRCRLFKDGTSKCSNLQTGARGNL